MTDITPEELRKLRYSRARLVGGVDGAIGRAADTIERQAAQLAELEGLLRLCAVFTTEASGNEESENESCEQTVSAKLEDIPDLVSDRLSERECRIAELSQQVAAMRADAERLDWLADPNQGIGNVQLPNDCVLDNVHSLRDAIDAARQLDAARAKTE